MTVSFDGLISTYKVAYHERLFIVRYDASTGLYTADVSNPTTWDLFRDDASVGDWIGFGWSRGVWHDLALTIGTALAGSGITLAWEYSAYNPSTGALTWTALSVTDGTSALTASGTVAFSVPDDWRWVGGAELVAGLSSYVAGPMVRCRITAATSVSEGGAASAKAEAKDYALKVVGSETPATMYAADVAAGWGRVTRAGTHLYACDANLRIGDGETATTFTVHQTNVLHVGSHVTTGTYSGRYERRRTIIHENAIDSLILGVTGSGNHYNGGVLIQSNYYDYVPYNYWRGKVKAYASLLAWLGNATGFASAAIGGQSQAGDVDIQRSIIAADSGTIFFSASIPSGTNPFVDVVFVGSASQGIYIYDGDLTISNLMFARGAGVTVGDNATLQNIDFGANRVFSVVNSGWTGKALNCNFDGNLSSQVMVLSSGSSAMLQYSISVSAYDSAGQALTDYTVRIVDSAGTVIYSGVYSAAIVCTVYTAVNVGGVVTRTTLNPLEIWVEKDGYLTHYEKLSINNDNRKRYVTLLHSPTPGRGAMASSIR